MITSLSNEKLKAVAALQKKAQLREAERLFVAEGVRLFEEVPAAAIKEAYFTEAGLEELKARGKCDVQALLNDGRGELVSDAAFEKISDVKHPQGALAVVKKEAHDWPALFTSAAAPLLMLLEGVQDPGNLGSILRTAEAAGAGGVILDEASADAYQPKVVRSTMGAIFRLPVMRVRELGYCFSTLRSRGVKIYAAAAEGSVVYTEHDYREGCAFIIGNEGRGLRPDTIAAADGAVRIPMAGRTESLNASVSAALLLYEAARQRESV